MTLNVNNIANEAGTGGPDFAGMPTVAGDPIVESGSNSDGEWTRWADGTQSVIAVTPITLNTEVFQNFAFPSTFSSSPGFGIGMASEPTTLNGNGATGWYERLHQVSVVSGNLATYSVLFRAGYYGIINIQGNVAIIATGRWK